MTRTTLTRQPALNRAAQAARRLTTAISAGLMTAAAAGALALAQAGAAQATQITARLTAQDFYAAYTGAADGSALTLLGSAGDWFTAEDYSATAPAGSYLYVVAWAITSNESNVFQGSVSVLGGGTTYTDATHWQATLRPNPGQGWGNNGTPPDLNLLLSDINSAVWSSSLVSVTPPNNPQLNPHGGSQAQWIWLNSFNAPSGPSPYVIFRTALDAPLVSSVPEPAAGLLALSGLAALAGLRWAGRRRTSAQHQA